MSKNIKKNVLFLCTGNSCRSQMAEAWTRHFWADIIEAFSAGVEKHGLNSYAVYVMKESGIDMSGQYSKTINELPIKDFDLVITVCDNAREKCPLFPGKVKVIHIGFDDPPYLAQFAKTDEEKLNIYRRVRDEIRDFVKNLTKYL
ncbi:MAG TPA: arsenate reductase ArsC [Candidatus Hydrogenedens sp.]|nr:arsenate reductase ArsC [Candidatus Hydrogenedens sp.]HOK09711.1 arsenate reductase ArsC [Candidatus Hydrogenedens sp.]HOL19300.1 arsenate reductase ArsC [Candidatus Hydrogenedens sp.]HPP59253.1 arsenate reductase ArsC [Candidatus Hydrogenedens sp.]